MAQDTTMRDVYIYAYPLITMALTCKHETNVGEPDGTHAPLGQMIKFRTYPPVDDRGAAAPNADTLYTMVWLDVSEEPWVFGVPDMGDRFYIMPMLSGYNEVFFVAGSRATGNAAQQYAITGPGWSGDIPEGLTHVESPTGLIWILGRVYCEGTDEDYAAVHELQDQFVSMPLHAYGSDYEPPVGVVDESVDMQTAVRQQVHSMPVVDYFGYFAELLKTNPPKPEDTEIVAAMAEIGIVPGQELDADQLAEAGAFDPRSALGLLMGRMKAQPRVNGWVYWTSNAGQYGTDYVQRAMITMVGPGMNFAEDAIYAFSESDAEGGEYSGADARYVMRFENGQMPPVEGFWSLTIYDAEYFFVPNPLDRYCLSQRDTFVAEPDGTVELYVQADSPGPDLETNWLPAPRGKFIPMLRLYWPSATRPSILDGSWTPPPLARR